MTAKPANGRRFLHLFIYSFTVVLRFFCGNLHWLSINSTEQDMIGKKKGIRWIKRRSTVQPKGSDGAKAASKGNVCMYIVPVILQKSYCLINEMALAFRSPLKGWQSITGNNYWNSYCSCCDNWCTCCLLVWQLQLSLPSLKLWLPLGTRTHGSGSSQLTSVDQVPLCGVLHFDSRSGD